MSEVKYKIFLELDELMAKFIEQHGNFPKYFIISLEQYTRLIACINYRHKLWYGDDYHEIKTLDKYREIQIIIAEFAASNINFLELNQTKVDKNQPNYSNILDHIKR